VPPRPPDPKSTARIRSGYTRLPRSTIDPWTRSIAPVHAPAVAYSRAGDVRPWI
jgi:hypothetical protein